MSVARKTVNQAMTASFLNQHPETSIMNMLSERAQLYRCIREFMHARNILEVETPYLSTSATTDPNLHSLQTTLQLPDGQSRNLFLHTSPELTMKRILAADHTSIYQIAKVFRDQEIGSLHQPEFSMLEWYRVGYDTNRLMDEINDLLSVLHLPVADKISYQDFFLSHFNVNPHQCDVSTLEQLASRHGFVSQQPDRSLLLDFLISHVIKEKGSLPRSFFIYDYPVCQSALAKIKIGDVDVADRFELFINGIEIANGFNELNNSAEQRLRFQNENAWRKDNGLPVVNIDHAFLDSLNEMPDCAGVAVGLDRLLVCLTGQECLSDVLRFPVSD